MCRVSVNRKQREAERKRVQNEFEMYNSNKRRSMWKVVRHCVPRKEIAGLNYSRILLDQFLVGS